MEPEPSGKIYGVSFCAGLAAAGAAFAALLAFIAGTRKRNAAMREIESLLEKCTVVLRTLEERSPRTLE
jgi:hypothetical protein